MSGRAAPPPPVLLQQLTYVAGVLQDLIQKYRELEQQLDEERTARQLAEQSLQSTRDNAARSIQEIKDAAEKTLREVQNTHKDRKSVV